MLKFNTLPRLANYSFAKSVLMAVHLGMSACSPLEHTKRCVRNLCCAGLEILMAVYAPGC